jgi:hypothetical protein
MAAVSFGGAPENPIESALVNFHTGNVPQANKNKARAMGRSGTIFGWR